MSLTKYYFSTLFSLAQKLLLPHCAISATTANPHYPSPSTTTPLAPLPKGAGLRQDLHLSNTFILCDTYNAQILQTISAVKTEGSPPRLRPLRRTPPTPHYPSPRTTQNPNLPPAAVTTIIHYSLFIIH